MRIVVTGGAGFIGSHLVDRLIERGDAVTVLDDLSSGDRRNVHPAARLVEGSVACPADLERLPAEGADALFHLAAQSSGEASFADPARDLQVNVAGTLQALEWCRRHDVRRVVFTSSAMATGADGPDPIDEEVPCRPRSYYGAAKAAAESYVRLFDTLGLATTIVRLFNVYGPRQDLANLRQGMASIYLAYVRNDEPILVKGSLDRFRDQTYVGDAVDALLRCLDQPRSAGRTYHIATGCPTTVRELIAAILFAAGRPADYPVTVAPGTPGDLFGCVADIDRARRELGFSPHWPLEEGLREMVLHHSGSLV